VLLTAGGALLGVKKALETSQPGSVAGIGPDIHPLDSGVAVGHESPDICESRYMSGVTRRQLRDIQMVINLTTRDDIADQPLLRTGQASLTRLLGTAKAVFLDKVAEATLALSLEGLQNNMESLHPHIFFPLSIEVFPQLHLLLGPSTKLEIVGVAVQVQLVLSDARHLFLIIC
jgi:hypothetical protein